MQVEGNLETIIELAQRNDVAKIVANYPLELLNTNGDMHPPLSKTKDTQIFNTQAQSNTLGGLDPANWNIDLVDAERVWDELGITGEGAVVGGFDTGVEWNHPALQKQYRGNTDLDVNHNYNWFQPDGKLYSNGDLGPSLSGTPYDCNGHGTHTMGTMVGDDGRSSTQVGMAPDARWIAVPGLCYGSAFGSMGDDISAIKAFQWFLCPTNLSGDLSTADCSKAPDVINNSWGSANPANDIFRPIIQTLRAAGIAPVFASGNPGAGAGSISAPGNAPEAITVGATSINDIVAPFSGRGPSFYEGEQKPELSAPGVNVKSTLWSGYAYFSGTSMAAPHVAGLIALMRSADLQDGFRDFDVDELEQIIINTSVDLGEIGPDNDYGYGRINAYKAVQWVLSAGDLQGVVRHQGSNARLAEVTISGGTT